jgi:hypothetical protein
MTHGISGLIQIPISIIGKSRMRIPKMRTKTERNLLDSNVRLMKRKMPTAKSKTPTPISARAVHKHFIGMLFPPGS